MKEIRHSFFGYNAKEVKEQLRTLKADLRYLKSENERQAREIESLNQQLRKSKAEEELIRDAIIDAKHLSKRLVREAKEQATEMLFEAEQNINDQFVQFEQSMSALNMMKETIVRQKQELKRELAETIDRYRDALDDAEARSQAFEEISEVIDDTFQEAEEIASSTKQVIFLPKPMKKEAVPEVGFDDSKLADDIPVYSFQ